MPIYLTTKVPSSCLYGLFRLVGNIVGVCIIALGVILLTPALLLLFLVIIASNSSLEVPTGLILDYIGGIIGFTILSVLVIKLGYRVKQGKRRRVLFLRKFGFEGAYRTLTFAVSTAMGKNMRLITLDDGKISPVGVPESVKRTYNRGQWTGIIVTLAAIALFLYVLNVYLPNYFDNFNGSDIYDKTVEKHTSEGRGAIEANISAFFSTIFSFIFWVGFLFLLSGLLLGTTLLFAAVSASSTLFYGVSYRYASRPEHNKAWQVLREKDIDATYKRINKMFSATFAPRLVVLKVADGIWQLVVRESFKHVHISIIDISHPTEHLLWEIRTAKEQKNLPYVLIGSQERMIQMVNSPHDGLTVVELQLTEILDGEMVLMYNVSDKNGMNDFAVYLRRYMSSHS